jgi:hypothetical protein
MQQLLESEGIGSRGESNCRFLEKFFWEPEVQF